ncbi:MAG: nicotinamide-nucleotide adenylyltransferase [Candidatus Nitrosoabyssus spongiisocia]|nr:MAG: nicotinamide-nucleotide adenylyltransferase [Nitrosopumilaceae archaeon AB1(1)]
MDGFLIGRFQPFHLGHMNAVDFALTKVNQLFIGIGSSNKSNQIRNPFTAKERAQMITLSLNESQKTRIKLYEIPDVNNHEKWVSCIAEIVPNFDVLFTNDSTTANIYTTRNMSVITIDMVARPKLSGTNIRNLILQRGNWVNLVPLGTQDVLKRIDAQERIRLINDNFDIV